MGLLDSVLGAAMGGGGQGGGNAALLNMAIGMLTQGGGGNAAAGGSSAMGGLGGLLGMVQQFQKGGLGDVMSSWISTGQNMPISPDQLGSVLGQDKIAGMAAQLGMNQNDVLGQLSQMLPQVIDKMTPNGQIPDQAPDLGQLGSLLGGLLKR